MFRQWMIKIDILWMEEILIFIHQVCCCIQSRGSKKWMTLCALRINYKKLFGFNFFCRKPIKMQLDDIKKKCLFQRRTLYLWIATRRYEMLCSLVGSSFLITRDYLKEITSHTNRQSQFNSSKWVWSLLFKFFQLILRFLSLNRKLGEK